MWVEVTWPVLKSDQNQVELQTLDTFLALLAKIPPVDETHFDQTRRNSHTPDPGRQIGCIGDVKNRIIFYIGVCMISVKDIFLFTLICCI